MGWILWLLGQCSQLFLSEGESTAAVVIDVRPDIVDGSKLGNPHGQLGIPAAAVIPKHVQLSTGYAAVFHSLKDGICPGLVDIIGSQQKVNGARITLAEVDVLEQGISSR